MTEQGQPHVINNGRPEKFKIIGQKGQGESGNSTLGNAVLSQSCSQRRADQGIREPRGYSQKKSRQGG